MKTIQGCFAFALMSTIGFSQEVENTFSVTDGYACTEILPYENEVLITVQGNYRMIKSNSIPNHMVAKFPNAGNPNSIEPQEKSYKIPLQPEKTDKLTSVYSEGLLGQGRPEYVFGVAINGVKMEPSAMEFFVNPTTREMNIDWSKEALSTNLDLGDDCNNAHVQPNGEYHYHGTPWGLVKKADGKSMFLVGWAADGFPIYYKYGHKDATDAKSELVVLSSSYQLRKGKRSGDGKSAPDGIYDGTYVRDFEYKQNTGDLDEANGRFGVTPEFPNGTYYYVITDAFPSLPRFFVGTPDESFKIGDGMRGNKNGFPGSDRRRGQKPNPDELFKRMDMNKDGKLSKKEVKGPLQQHFDRVDQNKDGYITKKELEKAPRSRGRRPRRQ